MSYTKSSHVLKAEFLNSSFTNTISQAGDLGCMPPLDSIQSTPHLFRYNYLLSPRFVAVLARGMQLKQIYLHLSIYPKTFQTTMFVKCGVDITSHIIFDIFSIASPNCCRCDMVCKKHEDHLCLACCLYMEIKKLCFFCGQQQGHVQKQIQCSLHVISIGSIFFTLLSAHHYCECFSCGDRM